MQPSLHTTQREPHAGNAMPNGSNVERHQVHGWAVGRTQASHHKPCAHHPWVEWEESISIGFCLIFTCRILVFFFGLDSFSVRLVSPFDSASSDMERLERFLWGLLFSRPASSSLPSLGSPCPWGSSSAPLHHTHSHTMRKRIGQLGGGVGGGGGDVWKQNPLKILPPRELQQSRVKIPIPRGPTLCTHI